MSFKIISGYQSAREAHVEALKRKKKWKKKNVECWIIEIRDTEKKKREYFPPLVKKTKKLSNPNLVPFLSRTFLDLCPLLLSLLIKFGREFGYLRPITSLPFAAFDLYRLGVSEVDRARGPVDRFLNEICLLKLCMVLVSILSLSNWIWDCASLSCFVFKFYSFDSLFFLFVCFEFLFCSKLLIEFDVYF